MFSGVSWPYALGTETIPRVRAINYTWDAAGKLASANGTSATYDVLGRMVELGGVTQFVYGPGGQQPLAQMRGHNLDNAYVPLPGGTFGIYKSSGLFQYNHADWLGSSRVISTPSRTVSSDMAFAPFGEGYSVTGTGWAQFTSAGNSWTVQGWQNSGLDDFLYRRYSPVQGRWISPDPAGLAAVDPSNPQTWNRYAYVANNPLSFVDPSGLNMKGPGGGCDSNLMDCGSSGGSPSDPGAGGATDFSAIGNSSNDCPICSGPYGSFGTAGLADGFLSAGRGWAPLPQVVICHR